MNHLRLVDANDAFLPRLADVVTRARVLDSGEATEIYIPESADAAGVAWLLHDWLDGCVIEVSPRMVRVVKQ